MPSFAIIVLGTIGSLSGAIVGSLIVGFVRALSSPVLIGIGFPLGRSNYSALDGVMPYIFLIAILMIMPEGIGDAYEKWKIERLRKRKTESSEKSPTIEAALAIMPTGILGLHHWYRHRTHMMQVSQQSQLHPMPSTSLATLWKGTLSQMVPVLNHVHLAKCMKPILQF